MATPNRDLSAALFHLRVLTRVDTAPVAARDECCLPTGRRRCACRGEGAINPQRRAVLDLRAHEEAVGNGGGFPPIARAPPGVELCMRRWSERPRGKSRVLRA